MLGRKYHPIPCPAAICKPKKEFVSMSTTKEIKLLAEYCKGFGLNIGCGSVPIGNSIGVDIDNTPAACIIADAHKLPFADGVLDFIVSCNSFEHIQVAPVITLREWARCLKVGGTVAIVVPNAKYGIWSMTGDRGVCGRMAKPEREMEHFHAFTQDTLSCLFVFSGFKIQLSLVIDRRPERRETTLLCVGVKTDTYVKEKPVVNWPENETLKDNGFGG
jgi:predicted SAM-dependent methyltransferase